MFLDSTLRSKLLGPGYQILDALYSHHAQFHASSCSVTSQLFPFQGSRKGATRFSNAGKYLLICALQMPRVPGQFGCTERLDAPTNSVSSDPSSRRKRNRTQKTAHYTSVQEHLAPCSRKLCLGTFFFANLTG